MPSIKQHALPFILSAIGLLFSVSLFAAEKNTAVELGLGVSYMGAEDGTASSDTTIAREPHNQVTPQVSAGLYRPISDQWQLGTSIALDWAVSSSLNNSRSLVSADLFELVQQWSPKISSRYSFGFMRYFRAEPAYEYYLSLAVDRHLSDPYFAQLSYTYASVEMEPFANQGSALNKTYIHLLSLSIKRRF